MYLISREHYENCQKINRAKLAKLPTTEISLDDNGKNPILIIGSAPELPGKFNPEAKPKERAAARIASMAIGLKTNVSGATSNYNKKAK